MRRVLLISAMLFAGILFGYINAASQPETIPFLVREDFETPAPWLLFEEIVGGNICYRTGIGQAARETDVVHRGAYGWHVWANQARSDSSNHVISYRQFVDSPQAGPLHYEMYAFIDSDKASGQSGPEFSMQNTEESGAAFLTSVVGMQYLPFCDTWNIWDSGTWRPFLSLPLQTETWYYIAFRVDFTRRTYDRMWVRGAGIDTVIDLSAYRMAYENKGFTDSGFTFSVEGENIFSNGAGDTDFRVVYDDLRIYPHSLSVAALVVPDETDTVIPLTAAAADSFTEIHFAGGETTAGSLPTAALSSVSCDYEIDMPLSHFLDTLTVRLWTGEAQPVLWMGVRSDTASLAAGGLPAGLPATAAGRSAFGATVVLIEFGGSNGLMLGDTSTTTDISDSFSYTLVYALSESTARAYHDLGFDTSPGSTAFRFYVADTYGATWIMDTAVTVTVSAGAGGGIRITVAGITRDLPGGLGGVEANAGGVVHVATTGGDVCIFSRIGLPAILLDYLRLIRDLLLSLSVGRAVVGGYYDLW